jgi:hypothetical protein
MVKSKKPKAKPDESKEDSVGFASNHEQSSTISNRRADRQLWYKICVIIYDLQNISNDHNSEKRLLSTTDELYISAPYFTPAESSRIKATFADFQVQREDGTSEDGRDIKTTTESRTIEEAIKLSLVNFFEKQRASGDSRPCGPHDLAPIYHRAFCLEQTEIQDERILSRLRRSGLAT